MCVCDCEYSSAINILKSSKKEKNKISPARQIETRSAKLTFHVVLVRSISPV